MEITQRRLFFDLGLAKKGSRNGLDGLFIFRSFFLLSCIDLKQGNESWESLLDPHF